MEKKEEEEEEDEKEEKGMTRRRREAEEEEEEEEEEDRYVDRQLDEAIPQFPETTELDMPPTDEELSTAIDELVGGNDNIPAEVLKRNKGLKREDRHFEETGLVDISALRHLKLTLRTNYNI
ncbi:Hypothetical predicted protein [Octopus vulgaris]|uniref:Uncharacterized protein n=1 Tax=Octopus vulgaris TaxID=6645 RepID=A0AA36AZI3_OCTVU|nr:Hypothetical predicted protein [Octopus vulgaris]